MSCHDIGRGLSSVVKVILKKLDSGEISVDTARDLLHACRKGVHWCDGNESEAVIQMRQMRCGYCLKKLSEGDAIYSMYDVSYSYVEKNRNKIRAIDAMLADYYMCRECFEKLFDTIAPGEGEKQRKYIEETSSEDCWHYKDCRSPWEKDE